MDQIVGYKQCTCKSVYQDRLYGKGVRIHTYSQKRKDKGAAPYVCTVCSQAKM